MECKGKQVKEGIGGRKGLFMKIRIVSWNVRVVNEKNKRAIIRAFIKAQKADLVAYKKPSFRRCQMV